MSIGKKTGGRQIGTKNKSSEAIRVILDSKIDFKNVVGKLYELVNGVTVKESTKSGEDLIYTKPPDSYAAKILLEYRYGKPQQFLNIDGEGLKFRVSVNSGS